VILDSSAIVAILMAEPGCDELVEKVAAATGVGVGVPTLVEATLVLSARLRRDARGLLARFLHEAGATAIPFDEPHQAVAVDAWLRFGKGRHTASLNFGDCLAYATARVADQPLLCVGKDFARTDLDLA
jgi:ribonuclease VapC